MSFKVIENGVIWKLRYGFLFAFHSNYGDILYHLRDIVTYWSKIAKFLYPTCIYYCHYRYRYDIDISDLRYVLYCSRPRRNFVQMFDADKTRMIGLPFSSNTGTWRTDRRTDRIAISILRVSMLTHDNIYTGKWVTVVFCHGIRTFSTWTYSPLHMFPPERSPWTVSSPFAWRRTFPPSTTTTIRRSTI